jgi:hypothetical protein
MRIAILERQDFRNLRQSLMGKEFAAHVRMAIAQRYSSRLTRSWMSFEQTAVHRDECPRRCPQSRVARQ